MANLMTVDLTSDLIDLSAIPLDELRNLHTPALAIAIQKMYERTATAEEIQDQQGRGG